MSLLRRVPWFVWLGLALAGAFWIQEVRIQRLHAAQGAAREAQFQAALGAIHSQRQAETQAAAVEKAERDRLKAEIARNREALRALEGRSRAAGDATARDVVAARELAAHPSYVALEASAGRLGVTFRPVVR